MVAVGPGAFRGHESWRLKERCYGCEKMIIWCTCHMCFGELLVDPVSLIRKSSSKALNPTYIQKKKYVAMQQVLIVWTYQIKKAAFVRCKGFSFKTPTTGWTKSTVDRGPLKAEVVFVQILRADRYQTYSWLVVWDNLSHWLIFFNMVKTTNQTELEGATFLQTYIDLIWQW